MDNVIPGDGQSFKMPFTSIEISRAIVRLIHRQGGVQLDVQDISARPSFSSNGRLMYVIITQKSGIEGVVAEALTTVSQHLRTAIGVWVLSEGEVAQLVKNAQAL